MRRSTSMDNSDSSNLRGVVGVCFGLALSLSIAALMNGGAVVGLAGVVLVLCTGPVALLLMDLRPRKGGAQSDRELLDLVRSIHDRGNLSEEARRVLSRREDREVLRAAIEEDIAAEDWDAAMVMVRELAERYGYRVEAEEFRQRIERARSEREAAAVTEQVAYLDGLIFQRRWDVALADAARIGRVYPDAAGARGLRERVEKAKAAAKEDVLQKFRLAVERQDAEGAMVLLKELDQYLTEDEALAMAETGREVVGKARELMGEQFKNAVQDKRWKDAAAYGDRILVEFPNTRMAAEIREAIAGIREKAGA